VSCKPVLATVARTGAYSDLTGTPTLATVATSGAYSDLTGKPSLATVATTGAYSDLTGKPSLATVATSGAYSDLTGKPTLGTAAALDVGTTANKVVQRDANGLVSQLTASSVTATTSGTSVDVTGIPGTAKHIVVLFNGVSTSVASSKRIQLGSGSVQATGYVNMSSYTTTGTGSITDTAGFPLPSSGSGAEVISGKIDLYNAGSNTWIGNGSVSAAGGAANGMYHVAGNVALSGSLDRIRLTTSGSDTFDAGSITVLWE
jgi:hypothetical protein